MGEKREKDKHWYLEHFCNSLEFLAKSKYENRIWREEVVFNKKRNPAFFYKESLI